MCRPMQRCRAITLSSVDINVLAKQRHDLGGVLLFRRLDNRLRVRRARKNDGYETGL